jgi:hypothetical protein
MPNRLTHGLTLVGDWKMAGLSAREAGERVGLTKQAIVKAIKNGRISATKDETGEWRVDAAELFRVYPPVPTDGSNQPPTETSSDTTGLQREIELLRERIDDLTEDRDAWRGQAEQALRLLTDQRAAPQPAVRRGWWRRLRG